MYEMASNTTDFCKEHCVEHKMWADMNAPGSLKAAEPAWASSVQYDMESNMNGGSASTCDATVCAVADEMMSPMEKSEKVDAIHTRRRLRERRQRRVLIEERRRRMLSEGKMDKEAMRRQLEADFWEERGISVVKMAHEQRAHTRSPFRKSRRAVFKRRMMGRN